MHNRRALEGVQWRERSMTSVSFSLFTSGKLLCSNVIVQRQFLGPLRFVSDPPEMPFQVLLPITGITGQCTAITSCRTNSSLERYYNLFNEWKVLHGIPFSRKKPRITFQSRHSPAGSQTAEQSFATVTVNFGHCKRSFEIPSDLVFIPTLRTENETDISTKAFILFVLTLFSCIPVCVCVSCSC